MKAIAVTILTAGISVLMTVFFQAPGEAERREATGPVTGLPEVMQRAFDAGRDFERLKPPRPGDWLAEHRERGQTYEEFVNARHHRPEGARRKIYLQALGPFAPDRSPSMESLREYAEAFFAGEVVVLPPLALEGEGQEFTTRINQITRKRQLHAGDVLHFLWRNLPSDAYCILAVTMEDLYPDPAWNYVFGQASLTERVGVYSFARYDPAFYGERRDADYRKILLMRSCKVLSHEMAHMFGLEHCIYFCCIMNGSNHLKESDERPFHPCPVCLRKLQHSIGFDIVDWHRNLSLVYRKQGLGAEATWVRDRLQFISGGR